MNEKIKLQMKINRARYNIMFMALLSVINIMTGKLIMPFSSAIATYSTAFGIRFANEYNNNSFKIFGYTLAVITVAFLLFCYFKSKNNELFFAMAFGFTVTDTICLICFSAFIGYFLKVSTILDIALHILTIVYLFGALKAYRRLSRKFTNNNQADAQSDYSDTPEDEDDELEKYKDNGGQILLDADYNSYNIFIVENHDNIQIVVNGYICDTLQLPETQEYDHCLTVNDIDIKFSHRESENGIELRLYANDTLIAESL